MPGKTRYNLLQKIFFVKTDSKKNDFNLLTTLNIKVVVVVEGKNVINSHFICKINAMVAIKVYVINLLHLITFDYIFSS